MLAAQFHECFVGSLDDSLAADVDPRPGGHLAEHHQTLPVEFPEVLPGGPGGDEIRVGDQHARGIGVGPEDADRLAGLDDEGFVRFQFTERLDDRFVGGVVPRRLADSSVDDQILRPFGNVRVEVVHQHAKRRLSEPALRREVRAGGSPDGWTTNGCGLNGFHDDFSSPDDGTRRCIWGFDQWPAPRPAIAAAKCLAVSARSTCSPPTTLHSPWTMTRSIGNG